MNNFIAGFVAAGFTMAGLFFLRFWSRTRDGLFLIFACAFWLFALSATLVSIAGVPREEQSWIYLLRLAGFVLIVAGIVSKNTRGNRP